MPAQVLISPYWAREVNPQAAEDLLDELIYVWPYSRRLMSPLPEDEEEDDEDGSEAELKEVAGPRKVAVTPFDWSAASARIDKILPAETQDTPRPPAVTTVILSQEILTPRQAKLLETIDTYRKEVDFLPKASNESAVETPVRSLPRYNTNPRRKESNSTHQLNKEPFKEAIKSPVLRSIGPESADRWEATKLESSLQRTLVQVPKMEDVEVREMGQEQTLPCSRPLSSASTTTERPVTSAIVQVFWFLLVFLFVHHVLKVLRVGPILGFFGATGPEAIGYWNAMEAMVDFLLFRLF
ncbi:hypothetical protein TSMEX_003008 [Taenia solium]|eukprot:TsM_001015100 transcript=TsM_001015100 gene=TsM_001015100